MTEFEELRKLVRAELEEFRTKTGPPFSHKDADGRLCKGPFIISLSADKRTCSWCRREESYSPTEIVIVFKKGVSAVAARNFINDFKLNNCALRFVEDKARSVVEKNGLVAVMVAILPAFGKTPEEWIFEAEKAELIWFASRVMVVSFSAFVELTPPKAIALVKKKQSTAPPDFPDEFQKI